MKGFNRFVWKTRLLILVTIMNMVTVNHKLFFHSLPVWWLARVSLAYFRFRKQSFNPGSNLIKNINLWWYRSKVGWNMMVYGLINGEKQQAWFQQNRWQGIGIHPRALLILAAYKKNCSPNNIFNKIPRAQIPWNRKYQRYKFRKTASDHAWKQKWKCCSPGNPRSNTRFVQN